MEDIKNKIRERYVTENEFLQQIIALNSLVRGASTRGKIAITVSLINTVMIAIILFF